MTFLLLNKKDPISTNNGKRLHVAFKDVSGSF